MLDYFTYNSYSILYFITFLIINTILLVNVLIAFFYNSFKEELEKQTIYQVLGNKEHL
jgi:hypothetical protein